MKKTVASTSPHFANTPSNGDGLPDDKRSAQINYLNDIYSLARMASIGQKMVEDALCISRAAKREDSIYTFNFTKNWLDDLNFIADELSARAAQLMDDRHVIEDIIYEELDD